MPSEKTLLGLYLAQQAMDAGMTYNALNRGATEMNPILGQDPNKMLMKKGALTGASLMALKGLDKKERKKALIIMNALYGLLLANNLYQNYK